MYVLGYSKSNSHFELLVTLAFEAGFSPSPSAFRLQCDDETPKNLRAFFSKSAPSPTVAAIFCSSCGAADFFACPDVGAVTASAKSGFDWIRIEAGTDGFFVPAEEGAAVLLYSVFGIGCGTTAAEPLVLYCEGW